MRNFNKLKSYFSTFRSGSKVKNLYKNPIALVLGLNGLLYLGWKLKGVSQQFLVKHFSYERFNIRQHRYYTMVTYAFSHYGIFSCLFDSLILAGVGNNIIKSHGNRAFWLLYLGGAISGAVFMQLFRPHNSIIIPEVGAKASISSLLTFYALNNLTGHFFLFGMPIKVPILLAGLGIYSLIDPSKKQLGGMLAGLLIYQIFKIRM